MLFDLEPDITRMRAVSYRAAGDDVTLLRW